MYVVQGSCSCSESCSIFSANSPFFSPTVQWYNTLFANNAPHKDRYKQDHYDDQQRRWAIIKHFYTSLFPFYFNWTSNITFRLHVCQVRSYTQFLMIHSAIKVLGIVLSSSSLSLLWTLHLLLDWGSFTLLWTSFFHCLEWSEILTAMNLVRVAQLWFRLPYNWCLLSKYFGSTTHSGVVHFFRCYCRRCQS